VPLYRNDALHPTLSRALPLAQTTLEASEGVGPGHFARATPGRAAYGDCTILESMGRGGLTDFTFGGQTTGEGWSVNPYAGCAHACAYCYVPDTIKAERGRWGRYAIIKRDLPRLLAKAMKKAERLTVYLSTATDPYQPAEAEHRITRRCLEVLVRHDWPVEILTRSPLVTRDLDLLGQLSQVRVGFSIPTLDDAVRRAIEPRAPAIQARLRALRRVADEAIPTFVNITPACPPTTFTADDVAGALLEAGAQWVNSKGLQRGPTVLGPLWDRLHAGPHADVARFFASRERQEAWQQELGVAFRRVGLALSTPFFNPPFEPLTQGRPDQTRLDALPMNMQSPAPHRPARRRAPARSALPVAATRSPRRT
jgi:hypothetical protein